MPLFSSCCTTNSKSCSLPDHICRHFSFPEIKQATNNFHRRQFIGRGAYGKAYKGYIDAGSRTVAVNRLNTMSPDGAKIFKREVEVLCQLRHPSVVSLIGFCDHGRRDIIIVYDYMPNGTLHKALYAAQPLPWKQRLNICIGAARGLHYLHAGSKLSVLHCDVKPMNILLDHNWVPKVSHFGLSRLMSSAMESVESWPVAGDLGYLEPERVITGRVTTKSDVYSFGVVLLEVLCGKEPLDASRGADRESLVRWAERCVEEGCVDQIVDPDLLGKIAPDCLNKYVEIVASCVFSKAADRPAMGEVVESLENVLDMQEFADGAEAIAG